VILCAGAIPIARFVEMPAVEPLLYALAIPAVINSVSNPHFILYARNLDFRREVIRRSIGAACGSVAAIAIAVALHSYWALIASTFVQAIVSVALSYWKVPGRPRLSLSHQREMLGFGGWLLIGNMLSYFALRLEYFYIGKLMDARTLGAYHVGNQVNSLSTADVVPTLSRAMFPALSMLQREPERLHRTYVQMQAVSLAISLPIGFGLALVARPLVLLLFGRGWEEAVLVVQTITPIAALQAVGAGVEALAMATNRVRKLAARSFVYVVVRTVAQFAGFWTGGLAGLLLGRAVAGLFQALYGLSLAASLTGRSIAEPLIASWRSFAAVAVMSAGLWFWPAHDVAAAVAPALMADVAMRVVAGGVLYVGTHLLLWQIAGRPAGAEALLLRQAARLSGQAVSRFRAGA
jgi:O-antigen/teichoic acid export membrane protein